MSPSRVRGNKEMIRKTEFASFEPSGQLKLFGPLQTIHPAPPRAGAARGGCTGGSGRYPAVAGEGTPARRSRASARCSTSNAQHKRFQPPLAQPVQKDSS